MALETTASNVGTITAIRAHHAELAAQLQARTAAVLAAAQHGDGGTVRDALHDWYRAELMPHIVAEEKALYSAASELDVTRLLVDGMLAEHRALVGLIADLALAQEVFDVATAAASARALFTVHLAKENDLLLPALDEAGLDLAALLNGMHEVLGAEGRAGECGCGCGHDAAGATGGPVPVEFGRTPGTDDALDVRALPHGQRHEIIFGRLDALAPGQALVIVNDHDPKPLRYQTAALWPDRFEWTYQQAGPDVWRVAITRAA